MILAAKEIKMRIPFNKPLVLGDEIEYLKQAIDKNRFSGKGEFTSKCAEFIEKETSCQKAIMTPSCTSALEMCTLLCNIKPGDEVIMPSSPILVQLIHSFVPVQR